MPRRSPGFCTTSTSSTTNRLRRLATIELARERGSDGIDLNTGETDTAARALYESMGFTNREGGPDGPSMLFYEREI